jgi:hypothetical protein
MTRSILILLACLLGAGCASVSHPASSHSGKAPLVASQDSQRLEPLAVMKWVAENEALVEWQVGVLAASCNRVATTTRSPAARYEALRLKAAYATSSYAIMADPNALLQVLDLLGLATLSHEVWIEEGRAAREFGAQAKPVEEAFAEIRERVRAHARHHLTPSELAAVETIVRDWRKAHAGPAVVEFIRFEAFADELARALGNSPDLGGLLGRVAGAVQGAQMLGERALLLASRAPRLAEWHAEAATAQLLAQPELTEAFATFKQLGELERKLPEQFKAIEALDPWLASMPTELATALAKQPELKEALTRLEQTSQQMKALEGSVGALEKSVSALSGQLGQLTSATQPAAMQQVAETAGTVLLRQARSLIWLATGCAAAIIILHALLRRWRHPQPRRESVQA